jgi:hypothetical protein
MTSNPRITAKPLIDENFSRSVDKEGKRAEDFTAIFSFCLSDSPLQRRCSVLGIKREARLTRI